MWGRKTNSKRLKRKQKTLNRIRFKNHIHPDKKYVKHMDIQYRRDDMIHKPIFPSD